MRYLGVSNETAYGIFKWVEAADEVSRGRPICVGEPAVSSVRVWGLGFTFSLPAVAAVVLPLYLYKSRA